MKNLLEEAKALHPQLVSWRRTLHQNPETGMELPNTAAFVREQLESMGYAVQSIGAHGIAATLNAEKPGKCILLRADMDALPIEEETDLPYKATNGKMHACGHDFHTAMLLGAAKLLLARASEVDGKVKFMFQPGEEIFRGAQDMIDHGILQTPTVDAAAMIHVAAGMPMPSGTVLVSPAGATSTAADFFEVTVSGKGGHGAMPDTTIDPLNAACHIHLALQTILSREVSPSDAVVVTVGMMAGGEASNVIPDTAVLKGSIRTMEPQVREFVLRRVAEIAQGTASAFRATADVKIIEGCPLLLNDAAVRDVVEASLQKVLGPAVLDIKAMGTTKMGGSEDFAFISQKVPSVMMAMSAGSTQEGYEHPMHHPCVRFNEDVLSTGAAIYAVTAMGWLEENR